MTADPHLPRPRAGAGRAEIGLPSEIFPIDGYSGQHDPISARILVVETQARFVLASLELPSLREYMVERLRVRLAEAADTPPNRVWVGVTHTLSAPHTRSADALTDPDVARSNDLFCAAVERACLTAATEALTTLAPCRIGSARVQAAVNVNREVRDEAGWAFGIDPDCFSDHTLAVVVVERLDGSPIATLYNLDLRPSITETADDPRLVSADCTGSASREVERARGGVALYLPGAMADQAPDPRAAEPQGATVVDDPAGAVYPTAAAIGRTLAGYIAQAAAAATPQASATIQSWDTACECPSRTPGPAVAVDLHLLRLGDAALLGLRPELSSILGSRIRAASPWAQTLVCTMVNGGAKQLVDDQAHQLGTRTAAASPFGPGAGRIVVDAARQLLRTAHQERVVA